MQDWPDKWGPEYAVTPADYPRLANTPERLQQLARETTQRANLREFTVRELEDLDCITARSLDPGDLTAIHSMFYKERWEKEPREHHKKKHMYDLPAPYRGHWSAWNPNGIIWEQLQPSLQIVTHLLPHLARSQWYISLMNHSLDGIDTETIDRLKPTYRNSAGFIETDTRSIRPVAPDQQTSDAAVQQLENQIQELMSIHDLKYGFHKPDVNPWDEAQPAPDCTGVSSLDTSNIASIFLNYGGMMPLLRNDLTDHERMGTQWDMARTLLHELAHMLWHAHLIKSRKKTAAKQTFFEPYFDQDVWPEMGIALECHVLGHKVVPMLDHFDDQRGPMGYWMGTNSMTIFELMGYPHLHERILRTPQIDNTQTIYPMRASLIEAFQNSKFWAVAARQHGMKELIQSLTTIEYVIVKQEGIGLENDISNITRIPKDRYNATMSEAAITLRANLYKHFLTRLKLGPAMSLQEQQTYKYAQRLFALNTWNEQFWNQKGAISTHLLGLMDAWWRIKPVASNEVEADRAFNFVQAAVNFHLEAVAILCNINITTVNGVKTRVIQNGRQQDLAGWNWRTCQFIGDIRRALGLGTTQTRWEDLLYEIEIAYMLLCQWYEPSGDLEPRGEHILLDGIWNNGKRFHGVLDADQTAEYQELQDRMGALQAIQGPSIFAQGVLKIITGSTSRTLTNSEKMNSATEGYQVMEQLDARINAKINSETDPDLRGDHGHYAFLLRPAWSQEIADWIGRAEIVLATSP